MIHVGVYYLNASKFLIILASVIIFFSLMLFFLDRIFHRKGWLPLEQHVSKFLKIPLALIAILISADFAAFGITPAVDQRIYIILIIWLLIRLVKLFKIVSYVRFDCSQADNLSARKARTQLQFIEQTVHIALIFIGIALFLMTYSQVRELGRSLIASAGLAGVIVGFAAQKSLGTFVAGFQVAFTQPIRIDDVVVLEGEWGVIEEITLTYVVIRIWDLRRLIVPIQYFTDKTFQNWTRTEANLLGYVFLNFDYSADVAQLRTQFNDYLNQSKLWDRKVSVVQVTDATEKTIQVRFLMSARNSPEAFDLRCEIREKITTFVQKNHPEWLPQFRFTTEASAPASSQKQVEWQ